MSFLGVRACLQRWQITIPLDLHRGWEGRESTVVWSHVLRNAPRSCELVQFALAAGGTTEVIQPSDDLEHGRQTSLAESNTQALMGPESKVGVCVHVTVELDFPGFFKGHRVLACGDLGYDFQSASLIMCFSRVVQKTIPDCT